MEFSMLSSQLPSFALTTPALGHRGELLEEASLRQEIARARQHNQALQVSINQTVQTAFISLEHPKTNPIERKVELKSISKQKIEELKKRAEELRQAKAKRRPDQIKMKKHLTPLESELNAIDQQFDHIEGHSALNRIEESVQQVSQDIKEMREENKELAQQTDHLEEQYREMGGQAESIAQTQAVIQSEIQQTEELHTNIEQQAFKIQQEQAVIRQELNAIEQKQANIQGHLERSGFSSVLSQAQTIASRTQQLASQLINQSKQTITHTAQRALAAGSRLYSFCENITKAAIKNTIHYISVFVKRFFQNPITWITLALLSYYVLREPIFLYISAGILFYTLMASRVKRWLF